MLRLRQLSDVPTTPSCSSFPSGALSHSRQIATAAGRGYCCSAGSAPWPVGCRNAVLGVLFSVDRSTVTPAVGEMRRLLAERGFAVPGQAGMRLRTLEDVFAYAQAEGVEPRLDATEIQVRRPAAGRGGRRAFVSGKKKQNTMKATVIADHQGRTLWADGLRPGRMHNATAARTAGIAGCFHHFDLVEVLLDDGYLGLSRDHPGQAVTPPRKPRARSPARQSRAVGTRPARPLIRPHHRRARIGRPQALEVTDALDPSP